MAYQQMPEGQQHRMARRQITEELQRGITDMQNCSNITYETLMYCLQMGGKHADPKHISLLLDCAEICKTGSSFFLRNSELSGRFAAFVAEVCDRCASTCEQFGDDTQMRTCYESCRRTSNSLRKVTGARL